MSALTFLLKNFPGIIRLSENKGMIKRRLRSSVRRAFNSKFYREKLTRAGVRPSDIRTIDDFTRKVPLTTRPELEAADPYDVLAIQPGKECLIYAQTSGTTTDIKKASDRPPEAFCGPATWFYRARISRSGRSQCCLHRVRTQSTQVLRQTFPSPSCHF